MLIKHLLKSKKIVCYRRHVHDLLIIYDKTMIAPDLLNTNLKHRHKKIIFKPTPEYNEQMNFLDLFLIRK
jgi:hypothetical protein